MACLRKKCHHSCYTDLFWELKTVYCKFWAVSLWRVTESQCHTDNFTMPWCEIRISMDFARTCYWPMLYPSLCSIFQSFIGLWVKIRQRNKSSFFKSSHVQSSRSKLIPVSCPRKGNLFRFLLNCTATSDGSTSMQKLGNALWHDNEYYWIDSNHLQNFAAKTAQNEKLCLKAI